MMRQPLFTTLPSGRLVLDTGKVQIGLRAPATEQRRADIGTQAEHMQTVLLATRHAEREHLEAEARRAGVGVDLSGYTDDEVEQLTWVAEHEREGELPFDLGHGLVALGLVLAAVVALIILATPGVPQ